MVKQSISNKMMGIYGGNKGEVESRRINSERIGFITLVSRIIIGSYFIYGRFLSLFKKGLHGLLGRFPKVNWIIRLPSILLAYIIMLHLQQILSF